MSRFKKIRFLLPFFFLFFSFSLYGFSEKNIKITNYEFNRYIIPSLKIILDQFDKLFFKINPHLQAYAPILKKINSLPHYPLTSQELEKKLYQLLLQINSTSPNSETIYSIRGLILPISIASSSSVK